MIDSKPATVTSYLAGDAPRNQALFSPARALLNKPAMTRLLMALFVMVTLAGVLALSGCDDDMPAPAADLSVQDSHPNHD